jgi:peptidase A4-like protein
MNARAGIAVILALLVVTVATAATDTRQVRTRDFVKTSRTWAGYVVRSGRGFTAVRARWVQPSVVCNRPGSSAAFWVGLGGANVDPQGLEQIGTSADCSERADLSYSAWYELIPSPPVDIRLKIHARDTIEAGVQMIDATATLTFRDITTGASFATHVAVRFPDRTSAEWIAEAPSVCLPPSCRPLPLADFRRVSFTAASATAEGHDGSIADASWTTERLKMSSSQGRVVRPTPLGSHGSSFSLLQTR